MNELQPIALESEGATADLVIEDGRVYCSNRREFLERDVAVVGDRIAALLEDADSVIGPETTVVSAADEVVLPGLIDAHTHADIELILDRTVPELLATGTTSIVTESSGLGLLFGSRGVETFLERTADCPVSTYLALPPQAFVDTFEPATGSPAELEALSDLLARERVIGVGEIDWVHVVGRDAPIEDLYERAREADATIVGHGAGCRGDSLRAFGTVVDNDHEAISADGIRKRADNGIHVVGRCGSNRDDLGALIEAFPDLDRGSVSLSTDGVAPADLLEGFGMAEVVRRLIDAGIRPADAIDAATRNPADHFGLADRGVVAPGAAADLLVVDDLETMGVETVVSDGALVVADGEPTVDARTDPYPDYVYDTVSVAIDRDRFTAPLEAAPDGTVRAMDVGRGLVTTETTAEAGTVGDDGDESGRRLGPAPETDALTATLLDRDPATDERGFTGFLTGYGLESGAVATTGTWESTGLVTVAADTDDAVVAAEHVASLGGGFAVARDGEIVADLATPIAATAAELSPETFETARSAVVDSLRESGVDVELPLLTVQTLTFPGVPALKLTPSGYADVLGRSVEGLETDN
ncbi:adenine deaminase C-terminal domain-containing protein [Natrinema sp. 1APR25-10V2]|uniref:adenine deaminase C-terminal domain-containing protein n=1 Tax=Natrinema sp. 1APR25-10V2 TaxID=2951081 RepID=UPI00287621C2|nr:adenine deaminase C-terminal domain-containing protein [Natrinema sp. 1APR25-10V2]MDS0474825.1 amidohydrolase family protein [Natrinema sp. 1APR25-10V2]